MRVRLVIETSDKDGRHQVDIHNIPSDLWQQLLRSRVELPPVRTVKEHPDGWEVTEYREGTPVTDRAIYPHRARDTAFAVLLIGDQALGSHA